MILMCEYHNFLSAFWSNNYRSNLHSMASRYNRQQCDVTNASSHTNFTMPEKTSKMHNLQKTQQSPNGTGYKDGSEAGMFD